jgi:hypothetical protein
MTILADAATRRRPIDEAAEEGPRHAFPHTVSAIRDDFMAPPCSTQTRRSAHDASRIGMPVLRPAICGRRR